MSRRPILPMAYAASRAWLVKWDKFVIPVPFARIVIAIGAPVYVPRVTDAAGLEALQGQMEARLKALYAAAQAALRARLSSLSLRRPAPALRILLTREAESKQGLSLCSFFVVRESDVSA